MLEVWEWKTTCLCCGMPIVLLAATSLQRFYSRGSPPSPQDPVAIACPKCKRAAIYDHYDPADRREIEPSIPRAERIRISCEEKACEGFLIVIAVCGPNDDAQEVIRSWEFEAGVRCSNGHQFYPLSTIAT